MPMTKTDQKLRYFKVALAELRGATELAELSNLELSGAIKNFELCFELAWKILRKRGEAEARRVATPREAFQLGLELGLIHDEGLWLKIIEDRNQTVHVYDREAAQIIFDRIRSKYLLAFEGLVLRFESGS